MNRTIFALCILALSLGVAVWWTLFILNTETPLTTNTSQDLYTLIETVSPVTVSISATLSDESGMTSREGTGIIIRSDGMILTSKHLVSEKFIYTITLSDGTKLPAKLVKIHPILDLALLSIIAKDLWSLPVGKFITSQASIRQWDRVIALGNTLGLYPGSVSEGIISGLNRTVAFSGINLEGMIQTNIATYLGNSGGPLVGSDGKIIGMNTGIVGGSSQIGWALPLTQQEVDTFLQNP